jgi:hypothetical protein
LRVMFPHPAGHGAQLEALVAPTSREYKLPARSVHLLQTASEAAPRVEEKVPTPQGAQAAAPPELANRPASHAVQAVELSALVAFPGSHRLHSACPEVLAKAPGLQARH